MVGTTLYIENGDIVFDDDKRVKLETYIGQNYKIWLETQYESDYRDPTYGFKLHELMQMDREDIPQFLVMYAYECLLAHPFTKRVVDIQVIDLGNRRSRIEAKIQIKPEDEIIDIISELYV